MIELRSHSMAVVVVFKCRSQGFDIRAEKRRRKRGELWKREAEKKRGRRREEEPTVE